MNDRETDSKGIPRIIIHQEKYETCNNFQKAFEGLYDCIGKPLNQNGTIDRMNYYQKILNNCLKCIGKPSGYDATWTVVDIFNYFNLYCTVNGEYLSDSVLDKLTHSDVLYMLRVLELNNVISAYETGFYIDYVLDKKCCLDDIVYVKFYKIETMECKIK